MAAHIAPLVLDLNLDRQRRGRQRAVGHARDEAVHADRQQRRRGHVADARALGGAVQVLAADALVSLCCCLRLRARGWSPGAKGVRGAIGGSL